MVSGEPHFLIYPYMAPGHIIPQVDLGRVLARRGAVVTILTTPHNASRFGSIIDRDRDTHGLKISIVTIPYPCKEVGLPEGLENQDQLPTSVPIMEFMATTSLIQPQLEELIQTLTPPLNCIISDGCFPFTMNVARKFNIPRISFHVTSCFYYAVMRNSRTTLHNDEIEGGNFIVPDLPDPIEISKITAPTRIPEKLKEFGSLLAKAEMSSFGTIFNTYEEMEPAYVEDLRKSINRVWCIGPVMLYNTDPIDMVERGKKSVIDEDSCLKWLDFQKPKSVLYVCFGSLCNLIPDQLIELAKGLEFSGRPFVWAIRKGEKTEELEKWVAENDYENRIKNRGLLIWGWAPQVLILGHPSIGGFLTHCGANGVQEGVCSELPMMTWPMFADQFVNEQLIIKVMKVGIASGAKWPLNEGEEHKYGVQVRKEEIKAVIDKLMDEESEEGKERKRRVKDLAEKGRRAVKEGGSSYLNITSMIKAVMEYPNSN